MIHVTKISGYKIERKLASGQIAELYSGIQIEKGKRVALKIFKPSLGLEMTDRKRFINEIEIISRLNHPHIVRIFETGTVDNLIYLIMEFLPDNLSRKIKTGALSRDSISEHLKTIKQIASALEYAHEKGIVHRDVKSDNIMFRPDGVPVLVDFGLAKIAGSIESLTKSDLTVGTPDYMSPEQIQGQVLDGRTDIYSLGVVFYEMLTGRIPYQAKNYVALAMKHIKKKVPRLARKNKFLQPLINGMMAKNRDQRISNASQLISHINKDLENGYFSL